MEHGGSHQSAGQDVSSSDAKVSCGILLQQQADRPEGDLVTDQPEGDLFENGAFRDASRKMGSQHMRDDPIEVNGDPITDLPKGKSFENETSCDASTEMGSQRMRDDPKKINNNLQHGTPHDAAPKDDDGNDDEAYCHEIKNRKKCAFCKSCK